MKKTLFILFACAGFAAYSQNPAPPAAIAEFLPLRIVLTIILGWFSYWIVKVPTTIISKSSTVSTVNQFLKAKWKVILISIMGLLLILLMGNDLPPMLGQIDTIWSAFLTGGAIPSWSMNFFPNTETKE